MRLKFVFSLLVLVSFACSLRAQTLGVLIESFHHKDNCNINVGQGCIVLRVVNKSGKTISAISITGPAAVRIGLAGGGFRTEWRPGVTSNIRMDFLTTVLQGKSAPQLEPEASIEVEFPEQQGGPLQVVIDVVVYYDGTAEVLNEKAFEDIVAERKAEIEDAQKIARVINNVLSSHPVHPAEKVIAQLQQEVPDGHLLVTIHELQDIAKTPQNGWDWEAGQLKTLAQAYERFIPAMAQHIQLTKVQL